MTHRFLQVNRLTCSQQHIEDYVQHLDRQLRLVTALIALSLHSVPCYSFIVNIGV
jgi:hypothetical protein